MSCTVYILHSKKLNRYYVGQTSMSIVTRLQYHLTQHRGYTSKAKDCVVVHSQSCNTRTEAVQLERKIKKRGAYRFIQDINKG